MKSLSFFKNHDGRRVLCWPSQLLFLVLMLTSPALGGWAISWLVFGDASSAWSEQVIVWGVFIGGMAFGCLFWTWRRLPIESLPKG
jgi:hypothetical protein